MLVLTEKLVMWGRFISDNNSAPTSSISNDEVIGRIQNKKKRKCLRVDVIGTEFLVLLDECGILRRSVFIFVRPFF